MAGNGNYDVVIIGGGPAGLTAAIYTTRGRLKTLLIEKAIIGGQIINAGVIENFPGFPDGITGDELGRLIHRQAEHYGLETITAQVNAVEVKGDSKAIETDEGNFTTKALIIAGGCLRQKLEVPGEEEFLGRGVHSCATCDGPFFADREVAVVGGGNTAANEGLHLVEFASKITLIHRRNELRAQRILQERLFNQPNIDFLWDTTVEKIEGDGFVDSLQLKNVKTGKESTLKVAGVFVAIGQIPDTEYLKGKVPLDPAGQAIVNENMETEVPGIYAVGDIRTNSGRQAITAAGDGAIAAMRADRFVREHSA